MEKKNLAIVTLVILLITSCTGNYILGTAPSHIGPFGGLPFDNILKIACTEGGSPAVLDPVDSWDSVANDMIAHVCDTLWTHDLFDPDYAIVYTLAKEAPTWNAKKNELTVILRENVWFHDGSPFNATAVKFTFDRILYFLNVTGTLPGTTHVCDPASLFFDMRGNCLLNETVINSLYNVTFKLFKPNDIFIPLLAYRAWSIVSVKSTPSQTYLVLGTDKLIGTGPFTYVHLIAGEEMRFDRWDLYWGSNVFWDRILWEYYPDTPTANDAFLAGEAEYLYDPLNSLITTFQEEEDIHIVELDTSTVFRYWGFNNRKINNTNVRKAITYAYNYSYYIEVIRLGFMTRAQQFLPPGFPFHNASFKGPYYNTSIARQAMLDAAAIEGWDTSGLTTDSVGADATNDANWAAADFVTYLVLEHEGWSTGIEMNIALANDMDAIGITIVPDNPWDPWWPYYSRYIEDRLEIWHTGWRPDYLDPFNMIEPLLSNMSSTNFIQLQDALIHQWLEQYEGTNPANTTRRAQLLYKIQQRAINELYVLLPLTFDKTYYVHHRSLGEVSYNIMGDLWVTDSYYIP